MTTSFDTVWQVIATWLVSSGVRIALIIVIAYLANRLSGHFIARLIRRLIRRGDGTPEAERKREDTLITVANGTVGIAIAIVAFLMILSAFGVAIGPLLAAAGIAGVAVGLGAQYLIRDVIAGMLILVENQYRVGDVVCLDATCGLVEAISLRMTTLRDLDGTVHHMPHGTVSKVANLAKKFARVNLNIGISYKANLEEVIRVVNETGAALAKDEQWKEKIVSPPKFLRVDSFADSAIVIKVLGDTVPLAQWDVAGELRKRLKIAFDAHGIEIPFPQRVVHTATP